MAFSDDLARDPRSQKEFWAIIEDTFVQVEGVLSRLSCRDARKKHLRAHFASATKATLTGARPATSFDIAASTRTTTAATIS